VFDFKIVLGTGQKFGARDWTKNEILVLQDNVLFQVQTV
jgi:hypothetical protein